MQLILYCCIMHITYSNMWFHLVCLCTSTRWVGDGLQKYSSNLRPMIDFWLFALKLHYIDLPNPFYNNTAVLCIFFATRTWCFHGDSRTFHIRKLTCLSMFCISKNHEQKRGWFSGIISACHADDPGSIPGPRITIPSKELSDAFFLPLVLVDVTWLNFWHVFIFWHQHLILSSTSFIESI